MRVILQVLLLAGLLGLAMWVCSAYPSKDLKPDSQGFELIDRPPTFNEIAYRAIPVAMLAVAAWWTIVSPRTRARFIEQCFKPNWQHCAGIIVGIGLGFFICSYVEPNAEWYAEMRIGGLATVVVGASVARWDQRRRLTHHAESGP